MRIIDADALTRQIVTTIEDSCMNGLWKQGMNYALGLVKVQPTIQLRREEQKIGEWIYDWGDWDFETCKCSECGNHVTTPIKERYNFCPQCGADMRGVIE